jgi:type VI secretion system lysozyme-like protein
MKKGVFFPSLLDKIVDDQHINKMIKRCENRIDVLEQKLENTTEEVTEQDKFQWIKDRNELLRQLNFFHASTGSLREIRKCVKRDLEWLFNTHNLCLDELLEKSYSQVEKSVLNYGLPDLTGKTASSINMLKLEKILKQTIKQFEPRIIAKTLQVRLLKQKSTIGENALLFEITGDLWTGYHPIPLQITTQLDLENGNVEIQE